MTDEPTDGATAQAEMEREASAIVRSAAAKIRDEVHLTPGEAAAVVIGTGFELLLEAGGPDLAETLEDWRDHVADLLAAQPRGGRH